MSFSTNFTPGKKMTPPIHLQEKKNEAQGSELFLSCHFLKEPSSISGVFQKALILNEVQDSNTLRPSRTPLLKTSGPEL